VRSAEPTATNRVWVRSERSELREIPLEGHMTFTEGDVPDLTGRIAVITGASSGLGLENARVLARRGAHVVLATRDPERTALATARIRRAVPDARLEHLPLDLADLTSVRGAAEALLAQHARIDVLVANAGVMGTPATTTADGFELQMGVNHLGHAALIARLLPLLAAAPRARVVIVTSAMARIGRLDIATLGALTTPHRPWLAYASSKLANLLYAQELARHVGAEGGTVVVATAHPGYAATDLQTRGPGLSGGPLGAMKSRALGGVTTLLAQSASQGALPQLRAATDPGVVNGSGWGPRYGMRGPAVAVDLPENARDEVLAAALFDRTEQLVGAAHLLG
jgi:NAD(P)-dependent dehydrogenase (short-subunit alcohol dehydrogenase family)